MPSGVPLDGTVLMRLRGSNKYLGQEPTLGLHPFVGATTGSVLKVGFGPVWFYFVLSPG
jgi:hypothetical protein